MIERILHLELATLLGEYPIVTILGPRQSGKTTLARHYLPEFNYRNLELPDVRAFAEEDPQGFLSDAGEPLIIDEIQRVPALLSYLQSAVDEHQSSGRFVITGSHQLQLREAISQSLAGRTAILNLLPLSIEELAVAGITFDHFSDYLFRGFLPRVHNLNQRPATAYANYFQTYVERDVRQLLTLRDAAVFEKFLRLLAGRTGQLINMESLGNDTGIDAKTIKHWLSVLEASFIIFKLPPFFENIGKRLVKSPKYYFWEPGLLSFLLDIRNPSQVMRDPLVGSLFENLVIVEAMKAITHRGQRPNLHFYRDNHNQEIDLLFKRDGRQIGIEIKSSATLQSSFLKSLNNIDKKVMSLDEKYLVYSGDETRSYSSGVKASNFRLVSEIMVDTVTQDDQAP